MVDLLREDAESQKLLSLNYIDSRGGRGRRSKNLAVPRCAWRKNNTLAVNFPFTLLKEAGIEPGSWVSFKVTDDDPKAARIEAGGSLKVRTEPRRPDYPCAFINVKFPLGDYALTGARGMADLESVAVDGGVIAFRLPGDLIFVKAAEEQNAQ